MSHRRSRSDRVRARDDARATAKALEARAGDRAALGELIRLTQPDIWRFLAHLAGCDAADDLTQETYVRAMDALPGYRAESSVLSWLLTIARRTAVDRFRREAAGPSFLSTDRMDPPTVPDASRRVATEQMLASLEPGRREAFILTQVAGFSYAEAAEIAGVPIGTIRSRVARARAELVAGWSDTLDAEETRGHLAS